MTRICMTTGTPVHGDAIIRDDNTLVIVQRGKIIGVLSEEGQEDSRTIRLTFTRDTPTGLFQPLQGACVEAFRRESEG